MIFFRQKLEEVITLPPPPVEDLKEAREVEKIIQVRTQNRYNLSGTMTKNLTMLFEKFVKQII